MAAERALSSGRMTCVKVGDGLAVFAEVADRVVDDGVLPSGVAVAIRSHAVAFHIDRCAVGPVSTDVDIAFDVMRSVM